MKDKQHQDLKQCNTSYLRTSIAVQNSAKLDTPKPESKAIERGLLLPIPGGDEDQVR